VNILKKNIILIIIITFITFCLSGCYDANSLETFYYVTALAIDKSEISISSVIVFECHPFISLRTDIDTINPVPFISGDNPSLYLE
jgi:hypothetical protein